MMKKLTAAIKAMADEPRLSILMVLALRGAVCVSHLQEAMKTPQPTVSRYLAILRNAGLLEAERKGQWVYYRLNEEDEGLALEIVRKYALLLKDSSKIKKIMDRLDKIEQQPSLTADVIIEEPESKRRPRATKPHKRDKSSPVANKAAIADGPEKQAIIQPEKDEAGAATEKAAAAEHMDTVPIAADVETYAQTGQTKAQEPVVEEVEPDLGPYVKEKKGKRAKKPQPPSLFDF